MVILLSNQYEFLLFPGSEINCRQLPDRVDPPPHNFNSLSGAETKFGVLGFEFSILRQKLVIICATHSVSACKISVLHQKLVMICVTRAGANLGVLASKISVLPQKLVIFVPLVREQI